MTNSVFEIRTNHNGEWVSPAQFTGEELGAYQVTTRREAERLLAHVREHVAEDAEIFDVD